MSKRRVLKKAVFLFAALLTALGGLISCVPETGEVAQAGPGAWIDFPRDGADIPVGSSVTVVSHAYMPGGVAEVMLSVNGTPYRRDPPEEAGVPFTEARQEWIPQEPGLHTLQVRAYDAAGAVVDSAPITVLVEGEGATVVPSPVPTAVPTGVPTEVPSDTPVPTDVPTSTPPPTLPPTATPTPIPPVEVAFWADQESITAGTCTTLHWEVENAIAVYLDDVEVGGRGTREVCPASTTTYILRVEALSGDVEMSVTITVSEPVDTDPPPVPEPAVPADGLVIDCTTTQTLVWLPVTDPSGVVYDVQLEQQITATTWDLADEWEGVAGKQVEAEVDCGVNYRWHVRARDGAGNASGWSAWYTFSVSMG